MKKIWILRYGILPALLAGLLACEVSATAEASRPDGPYFGVFRELPISDITPEGWLRQFLERQRDGLGLHHEASGFPFDTCLWAGKIPNASWTAYEQSAYLLDGVYRCGLLLHDEPLTALGRDNIAYVLAHPQPDGKIGPGPDSFTRVQKGVNGAPQWPVVVFTRMLIASYSATGDRAILDALTKHYLALPEDFGQNARDVNMVEGICWLYGQTGDPRLLAIAERTWRNASQGPKNQWNLVSLIKELQMAGHGVTVSEETKQPAVLYLYTGKKEYLDAALGGFRSLERDHELVDGVITSDERLHGKTAEGLHETCDISDYTWSIGYLLEGSGDATWADKIERGVFNAGFGAIDKDFKAHQYFSSPNQVVATQVSSGATQFGPRHADRQSYRPGFAVECCSGNVHRFLPNYTSRMWLDDGKGGIAAALYGPSTLRAHAGAAGVPVTIRETTDYPFDGVVKLRVETDTPVKFPLYVRIPGWAQGARVAVNGNPAGKPAPGTFLKLDRTFVSGDTVELDFPMTVRMETPVAGGVSLLRGPLVYSLKIKENRTRLDGITRTAPGYPAWDLTAASPWNYAISPADLEKVAVEARPVGDFPWTPETSPVVLTVPARRLPSWTLTPEGRNPPLPKPPLQVSDETERVQLIPDGATRLRLSVFPSLAENSNPQP
jgi:hypothetical protein